MVSRPSRQREFPSGLLSEKAFGEGAPRWYAVQAPSGKEAALAARCRQVVDADVLEDCFAPHYEKFMKLGGIWRIVTIPLFDGYFFVSSRDARGLARALARLSFPVSLVGRQGRSCVALALDVQEWLDAVLDDSRVLRISEGVIEADGLRVLRGPLRGHEGSIRRINRHKRMAFLRLGGADEEFLLRAALNIPQKS